MESKEKRKCNWCGGELDYDNRVGKYILHDHIDDSPESDLTAELNYARRSDY